MRPLRFLLSLASCIVAFFLLLFIGPWRATTQQDLEQHTSIRTYFNWRTPSSLFPPSAIISLTDDNSTFFLARPAAFGPLIPAKSLSGQLWIGSGFGDDRPGRRGSAEGELGCSDVPGWGDGGGYSSVGKSLSDAKSSWASSQDSRNLKKRDILEDEEDHNGSSQEPDEDDGTDDHLHHPLPASDGLKSNGQFAGTTNKATHADIQSLQESAEIDGKVVLLSRGGCGFLEKVKWVQRRGGIALIVGDDIRGVPLVTMYARGDTSNVTISSLFVSHTTAHLLSGLIPSGRYAGSLGLDEAERLGLVLGDKSDSGKPEDRKNTTPDKPNFTTSIAAAAKPTTTARSTPQDQINLDGPSSDVENDATNETGWLRSLFGIRSKHNGNSRRPPNSGHTGWMLQQEFDDADSDYDRYPRHSTTSTTSTLAATKTPKSGPDDGFVIGVQDWRDPDLVAHQKEQLLALRSSSVSSSTAQATKAASSREPKGGSITPGSGEYVKALHNALDVSTAAQSDQLDSPSAKDTNNRGSTGGWLGRLFKFEEEQQTDTTESTSDSSFSNPSSSSASHHGINAAMEHEIHEGLWVTLSPTSMSSSPFFDTLLVLVVSPLVTLTVVYALLLLRSRIRRRRWRAPKSVVERLPVRTYQTMPTTATTSSTTSSIASPVTASTPLLPSAARLINARPRPRSRTTSEVPVQQCASMRSDDMASPSLEQIEEKRAAGLAEWRRRYGGKQRECVVCLEEYVDGVSRVMSLPCGHEFHAECITPWLTTRRRTCPICKGDVVRSLARSNGSTSAAQPLDSEHDDEDFDDIQEQAAVTRNDDPAAARPVSREDEAFEDLERGIGPDRTR